jgi:hypothetical protein
MLKFVLGVFIVLYFAVPDRLGIGGDLIKERLNLFVFLALILWLGGHSYTVRVRKWIYVAAAGIAVSVLAFHVVRYAELNEYLKEYTSGAFLIKPNTLLLPLHLSPHGMGPGGRPLSSRVAPFGNASGYIAAQRGVIDLQNYEAAAAWGWPITFRAHLNPVWRIWHPSSGGDAARFELLGYRETGKRVEYILIWDTGGAQDNDLLAGLYRQSQASIGRMLEENYDLIYTSRRGFSKLYQYRHTAPY